MSKVKCEECGNMTTSDDLYEYDSDLPDGTMVWIKSKYGICGSCRKETEHFRHCDKVINEVVK